MADRNRLRGHLLALVAAALAALTGAPDPTSVQNGIGLLDPEFQARLKRVIIDSGVRIPEGLVVGEDPELDARRFRRTENGICLINKAMIRALQEQA